MMKLRYFAEHNIATGTTKYYREQFVNDRWTLPLPIAKSTYEGAKRRGYHCEWVNVERKLADIIQFEMLLRHKRMREESGNR